MEYAEASERMDDPAVDEELVPLFTKHRNRNRSVLVSIRMPEELLQRLKLLAQARDTRYQTLTKRILEAALSRIERDGWASVEEAAERPPRGWPDEVRP